MSEPDDDLLEYDGESVSTLPLISATFSHEWLPFLLGAVGNLRSDYYWQYGTDMEAVRGQIDDLMKRLLGAEVEGMDTAGVYPLVIPACALRWNPAVNPTYLYAHNYAFLNSSAYGDNVNSELSLCKIEFELPPGDYYLETYYAKGNSQGKFSATSNKAGLAIPTTDQYNPTTIYNAKHSLAFTITETDTVWWEFIRRLKNPSSGGSYVTIHGWSLRKKAYNG